MATHKNRDDRGAEGVILTISDGQVFWDVYVFVFVSFTCCQCTEQIMSDSPCLPLLQSFMTRFTVE